MEQVAIEIPYDVVRAAGQSPEEFARDAKLLLALQLFQRGRLSSGKASHLGGLGRVDFLLTAGRQGIAVADLAEGPELGAAGEGPVVADSGPLLGLAAAGRLDLLGAVFGSVWVPPAVFREVSGAGLGRPGAHALRRAPWAVVVPVPAPGPGWPHDLGPGEAEALALARSRGARLLLDDRRARSVAESHPPVRVLGVVDVLLHARRLDLLPAVGPALEAMQAQGYRLSDRLVRAARQQAGEEGDPAAVTRPCGSSVHRSS